MNVNFPPPPYTPASLSRCFEAIKRALLGAVAYDEAVPYLHIRSSGGQIWRVTVTDAGLVTVTQV